MKIGFFDSGVGGYTILSAVQKMLPQYSYLYYGDTAHVPYGDKTEEEIYTYTRESIEALFNHGAGLVVIACNTASAQTLRRLQDELIPIKYKGRRLLGVIIPTIETIIDAGTKRALLIGTNRTIDSRKYESELEKRNASSISLISVATPKLVPLIEEEKFDDSMVYLESMIGTRVGEVDTLILGCTHYGLLKGRIRSRYPGLRVISQDEIIPDKLSDYLERHTEIKNELTEEQGLEIILTKDSEEYRNKIQSLFTV